MARMFPLALAFFALVLVGCGPRADMSPAAVAGPPVDEPLLPPETLATRVADLDVDGISGATVPASSTASSVPELRDYDGDTASDGESVPDLGRPFVPVRESMWSKVKTKASQAGTIAKEGYLGWSEGAQNMVRGARDAGSSLASGVRGFARIVKDEGLLAGGREFASAIGDKKDRALAAVTEAGDRIGEAYGSGEIGLPRAAAGLLSAAARETPMIGYGAKTLGNGMAVLSERTITGERLSFDEQTEISEAQASMAGQKIVELAVSKGLSTGTKVLTQGRIARDGLHEQHHGGQSRQPLGLRRRDRTVFGQHGPEDGAGHGPPFFQPWPPPRSSRKPS